MNIKKLFMLILALGMGISTFAQFEAGKTYTIANNNDVTRFIQEFNEDGGTIVAVNPKSNKSYWLFESTGNANCYYVKNALTGKYLQGYSKSGDEISSGNTPIEYFIKADVNGTYAGKYRLSVTSISPHDFSAGTLGLNWKIASDATVDYDCIQAYASVSGGNPRSAWIITQEDIPPFSIKEGIVYKIKNYKTDDGHVLLKDRRTGTVLVEKGETNAYGLWTFIPTGNEDCWYMKNVLTGNYVQSTKGNEVEITMGTTPVEIMAKTDPAKGNPIFGFASTDQDNLSFENDKTFGINWKNNSTGQGFPVTLGGRPRSFWFLIEVPVVSFTDTEDNSSNIATSSGNGKNPIVERSLMSGMWNTLVVPFNISSDDIIRNFGENAAIAELDSETDGVMHFKSTESIVGGKPYLVLPTINVVSIITMNNSVSSTLTHAVGETYDYVGVYDKTSIGSDDYFLAADNKLKKNTNASGQLKPFRAYFKAKDAEAKGLTGFDIDGEITGIIGIDGNVETNAKIYNIGGQQVKPNAMQKGIYIVNGKKIVIK